MVGVGRDDGLPFERPGDSVAVKLDYLALVRLAGLAVAPMLCVHVLEELELVGRSCVAVESEDEIRVRVDVA